MSKHLGSKIKLKLKEFQTKGYKIKLKHYNSN